MATPSLPILLVHVGISDYLPYTLAQARSSNPASPVILLGDGSNSSAGPCSEHHSLWDYFDSADRFARVYRHFNTNPHNYELFCFVRWFVVNRFLEAHGLDRCLYIDSDVMLYADMEASAARFASEGYELTSSHGLSPHLTFIKSRASLGRFCDFVTEMYTQAEGLAILEGVYRGQVDRGLEGGACDMTAFEHFARKNPGAVGDVTQIVDGSTFDHNLNAADGYAMRDGIKDIRFFNHQPHGWHIAEKRFIRFSGLHFQGGCKNRIGSYMTNLEHLPRNERRFLTSGAVNQSALRPPVGSNDPLPVHFVTLALDSEPFIRLHIEQFQKLAFDWHWHVVDGAADLTSEAQHPVPVGEEMPLAYPYRAVPERSTDGTSEYLDQLAKEFPDRVTIYRKPIGSRWHDRATMLNAPLMNMNQPALLWRIQPDELWSAEQLDLGRQLFLANPEKSAAYYWCWFFVGPDLVTASRGGFGNHPKTQWVRTWRYRPGMCWVFEPPILAQPMGNDQYRNAGSIDPITHDQTAQFGLVFQHYAYVLSKQLDYESWFYGPAARQLWRDLQACLEFPLESRDYFHWIGDSTRIDRAGPYVPNRLLPLAQIEAYERTGTLK